MEPGTMCRTETHLEILRNCNENRRITGDKTVEWGCLLPCQCSPYLLAENEGEYRERETISTRIILVVYAFALHVNTQRDIQRIEKEEVILYGNRFRANITDHEEISQIMKKSRYAGHHFFSISPIIFSVLFHNSSCSCSSRPNSFANRFSSSQQDSQYLPETCNRYDKISNTMICFQIKSLLFN